MCQYDWEKQDYMKNISEREYNENMWFNRIGGILIGILAALTGILILIVLRLL